MFTFTAAAILAALVLSVRAAPSAVGSAHANEGPNENAKRASPATIQASQISSYTPYTWYASTGYCQPAATLAWSCGANCQANSGFRPVASGGDGDSTQFWYVGYDPSLKTVIVSHQGTNPSEIDPLLADGEAWRSDPDAGAFPQLQSDGASIHHGFQDAFLDVSSAVLAAVQKAITTYSAKKVTTVGHSLGAAIALLDAVSFKSKLPGIALQTYAYGLPRVGNQAFADYVDANIPLVRITNELDPIPTCPGEFLGYHHPSGELHIQTAGTWYSCPGQDNSSTDCIVGAVPEIWDGSESDHDGPYGPVTMGC